MATAPAWAATPKTPYCQATTADTSRTAPSTIVTLHTAGANGGRLEGIFAQHTGTSTAGSLRFWVSNDAGSTKRMIGEMLVTAITPNGTTIAPWAGLWVPPSGVLVLAASAVVYVTTQISETFNIFGVKTLDF